MTGERERDPEGSRSEPSPRQRERNAHGSGWVFVESDYRLKLAELEGEPDWYLTAIGRNTVRPDPDRLPRTYERGAGGHYMPGHDCGECRELRRLRRGRRAA